MDYDRKLDEVEQEIKALENSKYYQELKNKNRAWAVPKPTEQEKVELQELKEKLADLKKDKDFYQKAILSSNSHSVKKTDKTRKEFKKDTAIKDERLLLSDVAIKLWERFGFSLLIEESPTFGDVKRAAEFKNSQDVRVYFRQKQLYGNEILREEERRRNEIRDALTKDQWIGLIELNTHVNPLLHGTLTIAGGKIRLVLEKEIYEDKKEVFEGVVKQFYGLDQEIDVKNAESDSSASEKGSSPKQPEVLQ